MHKYSLTELLAWLRTFSQSCFLSYPLNYLMTPQIYLGATWGVLAPRLGPTILEHTTSLNIWKQRIHQSYLIVDYLNLNDFVFFHNLWPCAVNIPICGVCQDICENSGVCACTACWSKQVSLRPNWCVFQEGWGGPVGCQETKFGCRSCYTDLCVPCLSLFPSVSYPGAVSLFATIGIPFWRTYRWYFLAKTFFLDTNSSPSTDVFNCQLQVLVLCGWQDAATGIEGPLLHTAASSSGALCVLTVRYGSIHMSYIYFLIFL